MESMDTSMVIRLKFVTMAAGSVILMTSFEKTGRSSCLKSPMRFDA